ncbi:MAG: AzlD domain-containing protein [Pseudomonadota bacterium]
MSGDTVGELWGLSPALAILLIAALPTHIWRWLGVLFAGRLDERSQVFVWVKCVATALVAAMIAKLVLAPTGPLLAVPFAARLGAIAVGFGAYIFSGRKLLVGVIGGEVALIAAWFTLL